jgi:sigma-B regulation protein RsbU (phosphoserine phosphatase)
MRLYFRWKLFFGFFSFALVVAGLLVAYLVLVVYPDWSGGNLHAQIVSQRRLLLWGTCLLLLASVPPAFFISSRLNRPIHVLHEGLRELARGNLDAQVRRLRTYDEFEALIEQFNEMAAGLREAARLKVSLELQKRAQEALQAAHQQLEIRVEERTRELQNLSREREQMFTLSLDLICLAGTDGYFKSVNPAFERVLGYSREELLCRPVVNFVHPDDVSATTAVLRELALGKPTVNFENRYRCKDGSDRWLEWRAMPAPQEHLIYAIARDITDRKRAEQAELEMLLAREIQRRLLPSAPPQIEGFDLASLFVPADTLGGDYFDFIPMPGGRLGIVIADATGHGIGPALTMAATRTCLWSLVEAKEDGIDKILPLSNRILHNATSSDHFVTLALVELDPATRSLSYANCGHPPGYLLDRTGKMKARLQATGLPLGCMDDARLEPAPHLSLADGDVLVLLTDGITEAWSPGGEAFGEDRLLSIVREHIDQPAGQIIECLHRALGEFCGGLPNRDDITCVVLRALPDSV